MILNKMVLIFNYCVLSLFLITKAASIDKNIKEDKIKTRGLDQFEFAEMEKCVKKLKVDISKERGNPITETDIEDSLFGDIAVTFEQCQQLTSKFHGNSKSVNGTRTKRKAKNIVLQPFYKWVLPIKYYIDSTYFSGANIQMIEDSFGVWQNKTCLRFKRIPDSNYNTFNEKHLKITGENSGCWSYVGQITSMSAQLLNVQPAGCLYYIGTPIHEIAHALGFHHEQSREDRDEYVLINTENIRSSALNNFAIASGTAHHNVPYDYGSVMHYKRVSFSTNDQPTIEPLIPQYKFTLGQRVQASFMDVTLMNRNYQCWSSDDAPSTCKNSGMTCANGGYPNPGFNSECDSCICPSGFKGDCTEVADSSPGCRPIQKTIPITSTTEYCLSSPNYGSGIYTAGDSCSWLLQAPTGRKISFRFDSTQGFGVYYYSYSGGICYFHWVEIRYNGNLTETGPRYCGSKDYTLNHNENLVSTSEQVLVDFRSEYKVASSMMKGFKLCYKLTQDVSSSTTTEAPITTTTILPPSTSTISSTVSTTEASTTSTTTIPSTVSTTEASTTSTTTISSTVSTTKASTTSTTTIPSTVSTTEASTTSTTTILPSTRKPRKKGKGGK